ncbi:MAG: DUF167 domain-containing protein [Lentisphaeraceae bacterium]|nr:DUF167 domain-containing protein [Lentisphaeraceae bacterium]
MSLYYICPNGLTVCLYVKPGAKNSVLDGIFDGRLKVKIASPPVDGKANKALIKFLSALCGISKSRVLLVKGEKSRKKDILLQVDPSDIEIVLAKLDLKGLL